MSLIGGIYEEACPSCSGPISTERLLSRVPCERCLPTIPANALDLKKIAPGLGGSLSPYLAMASALQGFLQVFKRLAGFEPTPIQCWLARQSFLGRSATALIPHGLGKTTLAVSICSALSSQSRRCLLVTKDNESAAEVSALLSRLGTQEGWKSGLEVRAASQTELLSNNRDGSPVDLLVADDLDEDVVKGIGKTISASSMLWLKCSPKTSRGRGVSRFRQGFDRTLDRRIGELCRHSILIIASRSSTVLDTISEMLAGRSVMVHTSSGKRGDRKESGSQSSDSEFAKKTSSNIRDVEYIVFHGVPVDLPNQPSGDVDSRSKHEAVVDLESYLMWMGRTAAIDPDGISFATAILIDDKSNVDFFLSALGEEQEFVARDITKGYRDELQRILNESKGREKTPHLEPTVLVVESPTKARTISHLFGTVASGKHDSVSTHWTVIGNKLAQAVATQGHVYDLSLDGGFHGVLKRRDTFVPRYGFIKKCKKCGNQLVSKNICNVCGAKDLFSKRVIMETIRQLAIRTGSVSLATDPDSEGEKISFDVMAYVMPVSERIERAEFHEVTRRGVEEALRSPRSVSIQLVESQILRRIEDRWLGFELSKRLWDRFGNRRLSAGRAQSPVLGWIVDRFRESRQKRNYIIVELESGMTVWFEVTGREDRREVAKSLKDKVAQVNLLGEEIVEVKPRPSHTTDSLLADSYSFFRLSPGNAMRLAQDLFETGLTTYHRTGSTRLSSYGIGIAKAYIERNFPGDFRPRSWGEPGAHEAIRATRGMDLSALRDSLRKGELKLGKPLTMYHERLYDMIFRRFIASQMASAMVKVQHFEVLISELRSEMHRRVEVVERGYSAVVPIKLEPKVTSGPQRVKSVSLKTLPKVRLYSVGEVVLEMKRRGIGRPSTYAKLADTMIRRRYAFEVNGRIIATNLGMQVSDYLRANFNKYVSEETTRTLEEKMQRVEESLEDYQRVLADLYQEVRSIPP